MPDTSSNTAIKPLVEKLLAARVARRLTQRDLSKKLHVAQPFISNLESGKHDIRLGNFLELARFLGFELMLIPTRLVPIVESILSNEEEGTSTSSKALWAVSDDDDEVADE